MRCQVNRQSLGFSGILIAIDWWKKAVTAALAFCEVHLPQLGGRELDSRVLLPLVISFSLSQAVIFAGRSNEGVWIWGFVFILGHKKGTTKGSSVSASLSGRALLSRALSPRRAVTHRGDSSCALRARSRQLPVVLQGSPSHSLFDAMCQCAEIAALFFHQQVWLKSSPWTNYSLDVCHVAQACRIRDCSTVAAWSSGRVWGNRYLRVLPWRLRMLWLAP